MADKDKVHASGNASHSDLEGYLKKRCPNALKALPGILSFHFHPNDLAHPKFSTSTRVSLAIGYLPDDPQPGDRTTVYAHLRGISSHKIALSTEKHGFELQFDRLKSAVLEQPFSYLFNDISLEWTKQKLRALICFVFLAAGHIDTVGRYASLEQNLHGACKCIENEGKKPGSQTQKYRTKPQVTTNGTENKSNLAPDTKSSLSNTPSHDLNVVTGTQDTPNVATTTDPPANTEPALTDKPVKSDSTVLKKRPMAVDTNAHSTEDCEDAPSPKRHKADDLAANDRHSLEKLYAGFDVLLNAFQEENASGLKQKNLELETEIKCLRKDVKDLKELNEQHYQQRKIETARLEAAISETKKEKIEKMEARDAARKHGEQRKDAEKKTEEVEKKFKDYLQHQAKLAAEYSS